MCVQKRSADRERFITPKIRRQVQVVGGERIWAPLKLKVKKIKQVEPNTVVWIEYSDVS